VTVSSWRKTAMYALGIVLLSVAAVFWLLHEGKVMERRKLSEAADRCRRLAEQGDASREFDLGRMYFEGKGVTQDYAEALRWYRKAAEQGHIKAQFCLGEMYLRGQGTTEDQAEARQWIQKAAKQNDEKAEAALGYIYYNGKGVLQNYTEAANWYRRAADQGYALAQQSLAYMCYNGRGVPQDYAEAARLYRKAAEQGNAVAQQALGYVYWNGRGVALDRGEAIVWYLSAAAQGDIRARHALESLAGNFEFLTALIGFPVGLLFFLQFVLPGRKLRNKRQAAITALGAVFLASAGLSFCAFATDDLRYSLHRDAFHIARFLLNATAVLIFVALVQPKRKQNHNLRTVVHR
jgi:hypothetical protein